MLDGAGKARLYRRVPSPENTASMPGPRPPGYTSIMQPTHMGPYLIRRRLGRGGMGAVYEAEDQTTGAVVAVKVLAAQFGDDAALRRRFDVEIETLKSLRHPGIVRLLAFGEEDGQPYFAMEIVQGRSLEELLRGGRRFTWQETVSIATEIAAALKAAHDHGVVHRDLKPANLLFTDATPDVPATVKLADFGIARLFGEGGHTQAGTVVGTVEYMAPEQAAGQPVDHRADLYALGLVMYAMLTGRPPFQGGQPLQVLDRQKREVPPRIASLVPDVPPHLDELVARLLAKDPAKRPANALALARLLGAVVALYAAPAPTVAGLEPLVTRRPDGPDLLAPTRPGTAAAPRPPAAAPHAGTAPVSPPDAATAALQLDAAPSAPGPRSFARQPTTPEVGRGAGAPPRRNRHVTVDEERREREARAAREQRVELLLRGAAAIGIAAVVIGGAWLMLRRPGPDEAHAAITTAIEGNPDRLDGLKDAYPLIEKFLAWYPEDVRADDVRALRRTVDVDRLRKRAELRMKLSKPPHLRVEHEYRQAMALRASDPAACQESLRQILGMPADALAQAVTAGAEDDALARDPAVWLDLVRQQLAALEQLDAVERRVSAEDAAPPGR